MGKTLYLVSFYFAPLGRADGINRTFLARMLADLGWKVEVLCADNPTGLLRNYQRDDSLLAQLGNGVRRHPVPYRAWGGAAELCALAGLASDPFFSWRADAIREGLRMVKDDGVVMAIAPPVTNVVVAAEIARRSSLPLVIDFRDDTHNLPADAVARAAAICASTSRSLDNMQARYPDATAHRAGLAYLNGYPDAGIEAAMDQAPCDGRFIYAGLLEWRQDPAIAAHASAAAGPPVSMEFYGPTNYYTRFRLPRLPAATASFGGYLPYRDLMARLGTATAGISTLHRQADAYCLPSKVFQYLAAGRPVLAAAPDGALRDFVLDNGFGLVGAPRDVAGMAASMKRLATDAGLRDSLTAQVMARRGEYSMRSQVRLLSQLLDAL